MDDDRQNENDRSLYKLIGDRYAPAPHLEAAYAALVAYAWPVLHGWIGSGQIFTECALRGRPLHPTPAERQFLRDCPGEADELVQESLVEALRHFRECAVSGIGGWDPTGRAALASYFVGCCVLMFPNPFRKWQRRIPDVLSTASYSDDDRIFDRPDHAVDVENQVVTEQTVAERLAEMPPAVRSIVELQTTGYTQAEAAELLDLPGARAVEGRLRRYRASLVRRPEENQ